MARPTVCGTCGKPDEDLSADDDHEHCRGCRGSGVCLDCEGRGCKRCHETGDCPRCDGEG